MPSRAYRQWMARLERETFTQSECRGWCRVVVPQSLGKPADTRTTLTIWEARDLASCLRGMGGVTLTDEQSRKGLDWLRKYGAKGLPAIMWEDWTSFRFMGMARDDSTQYRQHYIPVWRVFTSSGRVFDYSAGAWQSSDGAAWSREVSA